MHPNTQDVSFRISAREPKNYYSNYNFREQDSIISASELVNHPNNSERVMQQRPMTADID